jgi:hypothetical protein
MKYGYPLIPDRMEMRPMNAKDSKQPFKLDDGIEQEIRAQRKFTLAEAIGRLGGGMIKGTSPVSAKRQAELVIERFLTSDLLDSEGALRIVLNRTVRESEIFMLHYDQPLESLARLLERLLDSENRLRRFVNQVDAEWGRINSERPLLEIEGRPAHPDDPYTLASVKQKLATLLERLSASAD